jgi:hypothetical protein
LQLSLKKLTLLRLIFFIQAIISSLSKGMSVCTPGQSPQVSELDNFFNTYVNPNSSFNLWVDSNGDLQVSEKDPDLAKLLPKTLEYQGESPIIKSVNNTMQTIIQPIKMKIPCKLETSQENSDKINTWITELNKI